MKSDKKSSLLTEEGSKRLDINFLQGFTQFVGGTLVESWPAVRGKLDAV